MKKNVKLLNNFSMPKKIILFCCFIFIALFVTYKLPSLARYNNRVEINEISTWDGFVATSYNSGSGSENDPYIISNASEFAYFIKMANENDYSNTYFKVTKNIKLNEGLFGYENDLLTYKISDTIYYINKFSNDYYSDKLFSSQKIGIINNLTSVKQFNGHIDFDFHSVYGIYITSNSEDNIALFNNLTGTIKNLYIDNALIYGGINSSILANNVSSANINNVVVNGYVFGKTEDIEKSLEISLDNVSYGVGSHLLNIDEPIYGEVVSSKLTGEYSSNYDNSLFTVMINNNMVQNGAIDINLGTNLSNLSFVIESSYSDLNVSFSNLKYTVVRKYGVGSGIANYVDNSVIDKVINKSYVSAYTISSSIINIMSNSSLLNSYNIGLIESNDISAGLVGVINNSVNNIISFSYNLSNISSNRSAGLVGIIDNSTVSIDKVFDASESLNRIYNSNNSILNISNSYYYYGNNYDNKFIYTLKDNFYDKNFMKILGFNEFTDKTNLQNNPDYIWTYGYNQLPVLYIDDFNSIASIHVSSYVWNNFSDELNKINFKNNIMFSIEENELSVIKSKYYYVSNEILSYDELNNISDWTVYENVLTLNEDNTYIIYSKIVDNNDNIFYMNSDILLLDTNAPTGEISVLNKTYNSYFDTLDNIYSGTSFEVSIEYSDNLSGIDSVSYYISNSIMSKESLDNLSNWTTYNDPFIISDKGVYVIYFKLEDINGNISYINTDFINYNGYMNDKIVIGKNPDNYVSDIFNINNRSIITLNYSFSSDNLVSGDNNHKIVSNILFPIGTILRIFDNNNNKVYQYKIETSNDIFNYQNNCSLNNCKSEYSFDLFKEVGGSNKYFIESNYINENQINENFTIQIDLSETDFTNNYMDVLVYIELFNENGDVIRSSLINQVNKFNIYSIINYENTNADLYITSDYNNGYLNINSDLTTDITLNTGITYKKINNLDIFDTKYEDMNLGLNIKLVDANNVLVEKNNLKNIIFEYDNQEYVFDNNNEVNIDLGNGINNSTDILSIITSTDNNSLVSGYYNFIVTLYTSYNKYNYTELSDKYIVIPVYVSNQQISSNYGFDIYIDDNDRVISQSLNNKTLSFDIIQYNVVNPSIKVSLYKKDLLTAYDQSYSLVNIQDYISDSLTIYDGYKYNAINSPLVYDGTKNTYNNFQVNLILNNFEKTGYKFVFDIYDGNKKIGSIEKKIVIK